jgi:hypothetical protein
MFGLILTLIAALAIAFASFRIGAAQCTSDADARDTTVNTSIVLIALGTMTLMCGILSMMSKSFNPFDVFTSASGSNGASAAII